MARGARRAMVGAMSKAESSGSERGNWPYAALGVVLALGLTAGAYFKMARPSPGAVADGAVLPEAPQDAARWVNGEPVSIAGARGQVLFVEGWHPA